MSEQGYQVKKRHLIVGTAAIIMLLLAYNINQSLAYSTQPPSGRTGSPGDGTNCTECHAGTVIPLTTGISTDIPGSGYVGGQTYNITVGTGLEQIGVSTYGFELSPQDASGKYLGTFSAGTGSTIVAPGTYIGHSGPLSGTNPSWTFQWTAPVAGSGAVTFYAAVVAANGNGVTTGDVVLTTNHTVQEVTASVTTNNIPDQFMVSATPSGNLSIKVNTSVSGVYQLNVVNLYGQSSSTTTVEVNQGLNLLTIPLTTKLKSGVYVVNLSNGTKTFQAKAIL